MDNKGKIKKEASDNLAYMAAAIHITHIPEEELDRIGRAIQIVADTAENPDSIYTKLAKRFAELMTMNTENWTVEQIIEVAAIINLFTHMVQNMELYG